MAAVTAWRRRTCCTSCPRIAGSSRLSAHRAALVRLLLGARPANGRLGRRFSRRADLDRAAADDVAAHPSVIRRYALPDAHVRPQLLPTADRCLSSYVDELKELGRAFHLRGDPLFATDWEACMPEKSRMRC